MTLNKIKSNGSEDDKRQVTVSVSPGFESGHRSRIHYTIILPTQVTHSPASIS
jgi:hypothetical protein